MIKECINLYEKYNGLNNRLEIAMGPHAVYTTDKDYLKKYLNLQKKKYTHTYSSIRNKI